mgnify:CR=1 FL=1
MRTDNEIKKQGLKALINYLGDVDAEKFISLMIKEPLDYTEWQKSLWEEKSIEQVSDEAMKYRKNNEKPSS